MFKDTGEILAYVEENDENKLSIIVTVNEHEKKKDLKGIGCDYM